MKIFAGPMSSLSGYGEDISRIGVPEPVEAPVFCNSDSDGAWRHEVRQNLPASAAIPSALEASRVAPLRVLPRPCNEAAAHRRRYDRGAGLHPGGHTDSCRQNVPPSEDPVDSDNWCVSTHDPLPWAQR